jgi:protein-disulfide isomerase
MMRPDPGARTARAPIFLLAALLTAVQAAAFITLPLAPEPLTANPVAAAHADESPITSAWTYGQPAARFSLTVYADLECPYCAQHLPKLRAWIDEHPDANLQWQHLPLAIHEPHATARARWAECVGQTQGNRAFWEAISTAYAEAGRATRDRSLVEASAPARVTACLQSTAPDRIIRAQVNAAARLGISSTPTLVLNDRHSGKSITLRGPAEGDVLLSAIDLLASAAQRQTRKP